MKILSGLPGILGFLILLTTGLTCLWMVLHAVYDYIGWYVILTLPLAPVTFLVMPWYELVVNSNWLIVALGYGGGITGGLLFTLTNFLDRK